MAWGDANQGGDTSVRSSWGTSDALTNVVEIFASERSFVARKEDGGLVAWGDPNGGTTGQNESCTEP